jgi:cytidylate kinase
MKSDPRPLRPTRHCTVVAIDGPAASGKSSTARWVADELGFLHVDSGSLYRAATAARLAQPGEPETWTEDSVLAAAKRVSLSAGATSFVPLIDGATAEELIRGPEVTKHVSRVAKMAEVRAWVNERVRQVAENRHIVVDGRDMGTVVFPHADLKVFLVADPWERARRRLVQQLGRRPSDQEIAEETERLVHRDSKDATQTTQAKDAVLIDTTYLTQREQVDRIAALARAVTSRADETSSVDGAETQG